MKRYIGMVVSVIVVGILIFVSEKWVWFLIPFCSILSSVSVFLIIKKQETSKKQILLVLILGIWQSIPIVLAFLQDPTENWTTTLFLLFVSLVFLSWPLDKVFRNTESQHTDSKISYRFFLEKWTYFLGELYLGYLFLYALNEYFLWYIYSPETSYFVWIFFACSLLLVLLAGLVAILYQLNYWVCFFAKKTIVNIQEDNIILYRLLSSKRVIPLNASVSCQTYRNGLVIVWILNSIEYRVYLKDIYTHSPDDIVQMIKKNSTR